MIASKRPDGTLGPARPKQRLVTMFILGGLTCGLAAAVERHFKSIDFDSRAVRIQPGDWTLDADGSSYLCIKKGEPATIPWIAEGGLHGGHCLAIRLDPTSGPGPDHGRDKINYRVVSGHDASAPSFSGQTSYFGFAMKLDAKDFTPPPRGSTHYLFAQVWQGSPFGPPVALELVPGTDLAGGGTPPRFAVSIRNNQTGANPGARTVVVDPVGPTTVLELDRWYTFVLGVKLGFHGDGKLDLFVNGVGEATYSGNIGYDPSVTPKTFKTGLPNERLELYFGPYRDRMNASQTFYFDRIRYGTDYESVR